MTEVFEDLEITPLGYRQAIYIHGTGAKWWWKIAEHNPAKGRTKLYTIDKKCYRSSRLALRMGRRWRKANLMKELPTAIVEAPEK